MLQYPGPSYIIPGVAVTGVEDEHEGNKASEDVVHVAADVGPLPRLEEGVEVLVVAAHRVVEDRHQDVDEHDEPEKGAREAHLEDRACPKKKKD
jgi:hypothetical protein